MHACKNKRTNPVHKNSTDFTFILQKFFNVQSITKAGNYNYYISIRYTL